MGDQKFFNVEQLPLAALILGRGGSIAEANGLADALFGYPPGTLVGLPIKSVIPRTFWQEQGSSHEGEVFNPMTPFLGTVQKLSAFKRDGQQIRVEMFLKVLEDTDHSLSMFRESSEVSRVEVELDKREELFRIAASHLADFLQYIKPSGGSSCDVWRNRSPSGVRAR